MRSVPAPNPWPLTSSAGVRSGTRTAALALAALLGGWLAGSAALAQSAAQPGAAGSAQQAPAKPAAQPMHYLPSRFGGRAGVYYKAVWGIDSLSVKWAESGELVRFAWRVVDADKAKVLGDKSVEASLIDPQAGVSLVVPTMEKVGQLRQSGPPEAGRSYWMAFSNKGRRVKRGDRVSVVIGPFRAENLVVD
jgi:hypothetical protein